jgi:hypothetical protein
MNPRDLAVAQLVEGGELELDPGASRRPPQSIAAMLLPSNGSNSDRTI